MHARVLSAASALQAVCALGIFTCIWELHKKFSFREKLIGTIMISTL